MNRKRVLLVFVVGLLLVRVGDAPAAPGTAPSTRPATSPAEQAGPHPDERQQRYYAALWTPAPNGGERSPEMSALIGDLARYAAAFDWAGYPIWYEVRSASSMIDAIGEHRTAGEADALLDAWEPILTEQTRARFDESMRRADALPAAGYGPEATLALRHALTAIAARNNVLEPEEFAAAVEVWREGFGRLMKEPDRREVDDRGLFRMAELRLDDQTDPDPAWARDLPEAAADSWIGRVALGHSLIEAAYAIRGTKFASEVRPAQWRLFQQRLALAEPLLRAAHAERPDRPEAAFLMMRITQGPLGDVWLRKAFEADPGDSRAFMGQLNYTLPRWGGSPEEMFAVLELAVQAPADSPVPDLLRYQLANIVDAGGGAWLRRNGDRVWTATQTYLRMRSRNPWGRLNSRSTIRFGTGVASLLGRGEDAVYLLGLLRTNGGYGQMTEFSGLDVDRRWAVGAAVASEEPAVMEALENARAMADAGDFAAAVERAREAEGVAEHEWAQAHARDHRVRFEWQRQLAAGEWVDLLEHGLAGWRPYLGLVVGDRDAGQMKMQFTGKHLRMIADLPLPDNYEVRARFRVPPGFTQEEGRSFGVLVGEAIDATDRDWGVAGGVSRRNGDLIWLLTGPQFEPYRPGRELRQRSITLLLQRRGPDLWVNPRELRDGTVRGEMEIVVPPHVGPLSYIGLGGFNFGGKLPEAFVVVELSVRILPQDNPVQASD